MQTYEQLSGAEGIKIFYRPERFDARALFGIPTPVVEIGQNSYELKNLSMIGLGLFARTREMLATETGKTVDYRLVCGAAILHEGSAIFARIHREPRGVHIELELVADYLDLPLLMARQRDYLTAREIERLSVPPADIDPGYKQVAADVLDFLRRYGNFLEKQHPENPIGRRGEDTKINDILDLCEERMMPEWRALWHRANGYVSPVMGDQQALRDIKHYTERILTPEFIAGPIWQRAYDKPLGYPGDFHLMEQVYSWRRKGSTSSAKLIHRLGLEVAECIATRMVMVQQTIADIVAVCPEDVPARITSLGSGPAQEIQNYLRIRSLPRSVEFTLIDQEEKALASAFANIHPLTLAHRNAATISCLHISFMDLLKTQSLEFTLPPQDLIYSVGLIDYLAPRRAASLVETLYRRLAPGGMLVIGNMKETSTGNLWPMEVICDWTLHYRNESEMLAMANGLELSHAEIREDPTGRVLMMFLRKT